MRTRRTATAVASLLLATTLPLYGCGSGGGEITAKGEPVTVDGGGSESGGTGGGSSGSGGIEDGGSSEPLPTLPDMSDIPGATSDCIAVGLAYAATAAGAIGMTSEVDDLNRQLEDMKGEIPEELLDDLQVIEDAFAVIESDGFIAAGQAMNTPEFEQAQANIETYLNENCGGVGG